MEANDAKTGVHCPRLRGSAEPGPRAGQRDREREPEEAMFQRRIHAYQPSRQHRRSYREKKRTEPGWRYENGKEEARGTEGETGDTPDAAVDLIFKCKQIYIVAKAPPTTSRAVRGNRRYSATGRCSSGTSSPPGSSLLNDFFQSSRPATKAPADPYSFLFELLLDRERSRATNKADWTTRA